MDAVVLLSNSALSFSSLLSFSRQPKLRKPIFSLKVKIADGPLFFDSPKDFPLFTVSSTTSDGNRRRRSLQRSSGSGRTSEDDENETPQSSSGKKSNSSNQEEIIGLFRRIQSSISKRESSSTKKRNSNLFEDNPSPESPDKYVKKSPISSPSSPRGKEVELNSEELHAIAGSKGLKLPRVEKMKLTELKKLAKSRGIKGYSKLKKSELVELLRS